MTVEFHGFANVPLAIIAHLITIAHGHYTNVEVSS